MLKSLSRRKSVNVAGAVIPLSDKVKILGDTLDANLIMAPHVKALSSSCFCHICSFRQIRSSLDDSMAASVASALISSRLDTWTLFCMALRLSTQLVFNVSSMQRLGLSCTSILVHLQCLQMNFSNNSAGFLLNGVYGLNLPPWPSKLYALVACQIFLISCNIMNLRGLCAHPVLISF